MHPGITLTDAGRELAKNLWPSPAASVANLHESPESWLNRAEKLRQKHNNPNGAGMPLTIAAQLWHTPSANDWKGSSQPGQRRAQLSEDALLWGMNSLSTHPDELTSPNGDESSPSEPTSRLLLNPLFVAWLMGLPPTWTCVCAHGQTPSASSEMLWFLSRQLSLYKRFFNVQD
jgi:hypothetical protein